MNTSDDGEAKRSVIGLNSTQRAFLRSLANRLDDSAQIGKGGLTASVAADIDTQLTARELVKIHVLKTADADLRDLAAQAADACGAEVVQVIGRKVVLYRHSGRREEEGKAILLPSPNRS